MKKLSLILTLALLAFTATAWAQNSKNVGSESDLRNYLTNQQYDNYTFNLTDNITIPSANGEIEVRYRATINMNGKTIMAENPTIRIFHVVSQGSLPYMPSLTLTGNGTLSGGSADNGGAIYNEGLLTLQNVTIQDFTATNGGAVYNTGTMTMSGGTITGCTASNQGGGIYNKGTVNISGGNVASNTANDGGGIYNQDGRLDMTGGSVNGNSTTTSGGGGINLVGNSRMTMSGGSIANNHSGTTNGGIYVGGSASLTMTGGSVTGNTATNYAGIRVNGGTLTMTGGSVTGNTATATNSYGGIHVSGTNGILNMSGNPIVSGNLAASSTASNVYLPSGKTITVNGAFTEGANVHVTHAQGLDGDGYRDFATGYATDNGSTDPATVFRSDNAAYEVGLHASTGAASLINATHLYDVPYLNVDATGDHGMATRATCIMMSSFDPNSPVILNDTYWYVVDQDLTFSERISIALDCEVNIILKDNTTLTANKGVFVSSGTGLHIWGQSTRPLSDPNPMGQLIAKSNTKNYSGLGGRRIGGDDNTGSSDAGGLSIHGGFIGATGGQYASGIHTNPDIGEGVYSLWIYGGQVIAAGGENGAGIGGCYATVCGGILITGGTVTGIGGVYAAGIGSGRYGKMHTLSGYSGNPGDLVTEIRITGGNVTGWGTSGAGIGGGAGKDDEGGDTYDGDPAKVYIDGGTVYAYTSDATSVNNEGAVAIGWGFLGMDGYDYLHIYDNAKVTASTTINSADETLQTAANGRGDNYRRFKRMLIEPCDHPGQVSTNYTDNNGNLRIVCDHCYSTVPYALVFEGDWNENNSWRGQIQPQAGSDVEVNVPATILSGCIANVGNITLGELGSLTIADGGQLLHTNAVPGTIQKHITGYGETTNPSGWYLLGAPIKMDSALAVNSGMVDLTNGDIDFTTHGIDLYHFNQSQDLEWENMRIGNRFHLMGLNVNHAYLYARANDATLNFSTTDDHLFAPTSTDSLITVLRVTDGTELAGYNLISNPFTCNAYLASGRDFWRMNATGDAIVLANADNGGNAIKPCEGIFVMVAAENDPDPYIISGETVIPNTARIRFTTTEPEPVGGAKGLLDIKVSHNSQLADVARVRFGEGDRTGKLVLDETATRLSIPQDGKDYSVVHNEAQGEMPLNFKAAKNGTYTISVNPEGVELAYLHLIDNMTGANVDLLALQQAQGPADYTFTAKTTDYESRFKLVFSTSADANSDNEAFAFIDASGDIIITGVGDAFNASLQIVDVMGRVIACRDAARHVSTAGMAPGVYVLRLIDGDTIRTQKIVIE